jgi:hypothetical protein
MPASPVPRCVRALAREPPQPARHQKIRTHTPVPEGSVRPLAERVTDRRFRAARRLTVMDESNLRAVREIFRACRALSASTGRPFSPDGHLVGSLGEVLAAELLDLTLMPPSNDGYDAVDSEGSKVEIKATTRRTVGLSASGTRAERLVVLTLDRDGKPTVVYDGDCGTAWAAAGAPQKNGQRAIGLARLARLKKEDDGASNSDAVGCP